jgi:mono/diheme cytochrome c family protein
MPYPRDYRRGMFKFVTSGDSGKPRRADLLRTIQGGLKGTAMPSFGLVSGTDRELLAKYVTYLSIRGQVEFETFAAVLSNSACDVPEFAIKATRSVLAEWEKAESAPAYPAPPAEDGDPGSTAFEAAAKRGYEIFTRKADNACITCHGDFGRQPVLRYDIWGTIAKPANLTASEPGLKGGSRPEDIYARIRGGIRAVGMPARTDLTERQVWDLVRFVQSAPNPHQLPLDLRKALHPEAGGTP